MPVLGMIRLVFAAAVFAVVSGPGVAAEAPREFIVVIDGMAFGPAPEGIRAGDIVVWVNDDIFRHTATARDGSFDADIAAGAEARTVMERAGAFDYYCRFHPGMVGRLVVGEAAEAAPPRQ